MSSNNAGRQPLDNSNFTQGTKVPRDQAHGQPYPPPPRILHRPLLDSNNTPVEAWGKTPMPSSGLPFSSFTASPFVQVPPALGHAGEQIQTDPLRRYTAATGKEEPWTPLFNDTGISSIQSGLAAPTADPHAQWDQYRSPSRSDAESAISGVFPSDSGYSTKKTVSVTSFDAIERDLENESISGHLDSLQVQGGTSADQPYQLPEDSSAAHPQESTSRNPENAPGSFLCDGCGKQVKGAAELKKHRTRHQRDHWCQVEFCDHPKGFGTLADLLRHMRTIHKVMDGSKTYICPDPDCPKKGKVWVRFDNFRSHLRRVHKGQNLKVLINRAEEDAKTRQQEAAGGQFGPFPAGGLGFLAHESQANPGEHAWLGTGALGALQPTEHLFPKRTERPSTTPKNQILNAYAPQLSDLGIAYPEDAARGIEPNGELGYGLWPESQGEDSLAASTLSPVAPSFTMPQSNNPGTAAETSFSQPHLDPSAYGVDISPGSDSWSSTVKPVPLVTLDQVDSNEQDRASVSVRDMLRNALKDPKDADLIEKLEREILERNKAKSKKFGRSNRSSGRKGSSGRAGASSTSDSHTSSSRASSSEFSEGSFVHLGKAGLNDRPHSGSDSATSAEKPLDPIVRRAIQDEVKKYHSGRHRGRSKAPLQSSHICSICLEEFDSGNLLKKHRKSHSRRFGCSEMACGAKFDQRNELEAHSNSEHYQMNMWQCEQLQGSRWLPCSKIFKNLNLFQEHLLQDHHFSDMNLVNRETRLQRKGRVRDDGYWCGYCRQVKSYHEGQLTKHDERISHINRHMESPEAWIHEREDSYSHRVPPEMGLSAAVEFLPASPNFDLFERPSRQNTVTPGLQELQHQRHHHRHVAQQPMAPTHRTVSTTSGTSSQSGTLSRKSSKRTRTSDSEEEARARKGGARKYMWFCCQCGQGPWSIKLADKCMQCEHKLCGVGCSLDEAADDFTG